MLIIDDEEAVGNFLKHLFIEKNYEVTIGYSGKDFEHLLKKHSYDLAMIDVKLPDTNGLDILQGLKKAQPACKTIVMTGYSTVQVAVDAIKLGANDFVEKPFDDINQIEATVDQLLQNKTTTLDTEIEELAEMSGIIFESSDKMKQLLTLAYKIATKNINVLIQGETGTGKELIAHFIHLASRRNNQAYIRVNCGALSETILESELFGHEEGAFTGASKNRKGIFEIANKGTLFLDEVGDASLATQVKLLRVIESGEYMRVGGEEIRKTNTRIISATNIDLKEAVKEKQFREDLFYRLNVVQLKIPPLRERNQDIIAIASYFLKKIDSKYMLSEESKELLKAYAWPGNVRELSNVMKRATSLLEDGEVVIKPNDLPELIHPSEKALASPSTNNNDRKDFPSYMTRFNEEIIEEWEGEMIRPLEPLLRNVDQVKDLVAKTFIKKALQVHMGNRQAAAEALGITPRQLRYLLKEKE